MIRRRFTIFKVAQFAMEGNAAVLDDRHGVGHPLDVGGDVRRKHDRPIRLTGDVQHLGSKTRAWPRDRGSPPVHPESAVRAHRPATARSPAFAAGRPKAFQSAHRAIIPSGRPIRCQIAIPIPIERRRIRQRCFTFIHGYRSRPAERNPAAPWRPADRSQAFSPNSVAVPLVGFSKPSRHLIKVVLPAPFLPNSPSTVPRGTSRSTPRSTSLPAFECFLAAGRARRSAFRSSRVAVVWTGYPFLD